MPNPALEILTRGMTGISQPANPVPNVGNNQNGIASAFRMLQAASNPMAYLKSLYSDSQIGQAMNVVQQNGGDARQAFYNLAKQKGVDPNDILNQLRM